jgi:hypothetical protein
MGSEDKPGLRLNELERFRKTSSRLALEAHSSCEVPAGCGGVVLRWTRPGAPLGVTFSKYFARPVDDLCLDGQKLAEQRERVTPGTHVVSFTIDAPGEAGFVLMTLRFDPNLATALRPKVASKADGRWRATLAPPDAGDAWRLPDFDDSAFAPLVEREVPAPDGNSKFLWEFLKKEATGLGLGDGAGAARFSWNPFRKRAPQRAWVRWRFTVDHEGFK